MTPDPQAVASLANILAGAPRDVLRSELQRVVVLLLEALIDREGLDPEDAMGFCRAFVRSVCGEIATAEAGPRH